MAIASDIATIVASSLLAGFLYHLLFSSTEDYFGKSLGSAILVGALFISLTKIRGMYNPAELLVLPKQIRSACTTWVTVFLLFAGAVFAMKVGSDISRGTSILFATIGVVALILNRSFAKSLLAKGIAQKRFSGRNIVLITDEESKNEAVLTEALVDTGSRVRMNFFLPKFGRVGFSKPANRRKRRRICSWLRR